MNPATQASAGDIGITFATTDTGSTGNPQTISIVNEDLSGVDITLSSLELHPITASQGMQDAMNAVNERGDGYRLLIAEGEQYLSDDPTPEATIFWRVEFYSEWYDAGTDQHEWKELLIIIDIETGEYLTSTVVTVERETELPSTITLEQNFPNPFNPATQISYSVPSQTHIRLEVYNILGQKVMTLVDEIQSAGNHVVHFDNANLSSGVYLYRLQTDD